MRVRVDSPASLRPLMDALAARRCLVGRVDETSCLVTLLDDHDADDALLELRFFVAAWASRRPGVSAAVTA